MCMSLRLKGSILTWQTRADGQKLEWGWKILLDHGFVQIRKLGRAWSSGHPFGLKLDSLKFSMIQLNSLKSQWGWNIIFHHFCLGMSVFFQLSWVFFEFIYFNWRLITLQYCGGFCHTFTWISHVCTCVPHPDPPSYLPPHLIPALSTLFHASNLDWQSILHMIIYMFQCYSLKSSHTCLLPQSTKVCSLHLCLFCCPSYRVIITIFLNHIYIYMCVCVCVCVCVLVYCIGVFLPDLLLSV